MAYKLGVFGKYINHMRDDPLYNGAVFATPEEANRAGHELLARWAAPEGFVVVKCEEPVTAVVTVGSFAGVTTERGVDTRDLHTRPLASQMAVLDARARRAEVERDELRAKIAKVADLADLWSHWHGNARKTMAAQLQAIVGKGEP